MVQESRQSKRWLGLFSHMQQPEGVNIAVADIDGDTVPELIFANSESVGPLVLCRRQGEGWRSETIDAGISFVHSVETADMDNDGDLDIVFAEMHQSQDPDEVSIYFNKDGKGGAWTKQVVRQRVHTTCESGISAAMAIWISWGPTGATIILMAHLLKCGKTRCIHYTIGSIFKWITSARCLMLVRGISGWHPAM